MKQFIIHYYTQCRDIILSQLLFLRLYSTPWMNVLTMIRRFIYKYFSPINFLHRSKSILKYITEQSITEILTEKICTEIIANQWSLVGKRWYLNNRNNFPSPSRFNSRSTWQSRGQGNTRVRSKLVAEARLGMVGVSISHQAFQWRY